MKKIFNDFDIALQNIGGQFGHTIETMRSNVMLKQTSESNLFTILVSPLFQQESNIFEALNVATQKTIQENGGNYQICTFSE